MLYLKVTMTVIVIPTAKVNFYPVILPSHCLITFTVIPILNS